MQQEIWCNQRISFVINLWFRESTKSWIKLLRMHGWMGMGVFYKNKHKRIKWMNHDDFKMLLVDDWLWTWQLAGTERVKNQVNIREVCTLWYERKISQKFAQILLDAPVRQLANNHGNVSPQAALFDGGVAAAFGGRLCCPLPSAGRIRLLFYLIAIDCSILAIVPPIPVVLFRHSHTRIGRIVCAATEDCRCLRWAIKLAQFDCEFYFHQLLNDKGKANLPFGALHRTAFAVWSQSLWKSALWWTSVGIQSCVPQSRARPLAFWPKPQFAAVWPPSKSEK